MCIGATSIPITVIGSELLQCGCNKNTNMIKSYKTIKQCGKTDMQCYWQCPKFRRVIQSIEQRSEKNSGLDKKIC